MFVERYGGSSHRPWGIERDMLYLDNVSTRAVARGLAVTLAVTGGLACGDGEPGNLVATATIGPDGGEIGGAGVRVSIPPGALLDAFEVSVRRDGLDLSVGDYVQSGGGYYLGPDTLQLQLPAEVSIDGEDGARLVHQRQDGLVVHPSSTGYIDQLGRVGLVSLEGAEAGVRLAHPVLAADPMGGEEFVDSVPMQAELVGGDQLDLQLTAYDYTGALRPLNGPGYCGFAVDNLSGGTLAAGCGQGEVTASLRAVDNVLSFDLLPFLSGKLDSPVPVQVVVGDGDVRLAVGFLQFRTGVCYLEDCGGYGVCVGDEQAACVCDDGYEAAGLECVCSPNCAGRECGSDGCGGSCAPGCGPDETCESNAGVCVPDESEEEDG
ncbi:MAG: hypothetical protein B7733_18560 [Myxococcales bacterium FL481]|nr:MAG: hypothetical protein B7733_18560 [Myxococcales bacterium FL481]